MLSCKEGALVQAPPQRKPALHSINQLERLVTRALETTDQIKFPRTAGYVCFSSAPDGAQCGCFYGFWDLIVSQSGGLQS